jgi:hypothetical protein
MEYRVASLVVISRYTTIDFLQLSDNLIHLWAGRGVLQPTPLDEIPHSIRHTSSIRRSFWPLTCQDSSTCTNIVIVRKDRSACVNLVHSIVQCQPFLSIREKLSRATSKAMQAKANISLFVVRWNFLLVSRSSGAIHLGVPNRMVM